MKVKVKDFAVNMELGNDGIMLDVYEPGESGAHLGDLRFGRGTIEWCPGRVHQGNGHQVKWPDFIAWIVEHGKKG
jgi:hypothetical protein